MEAVRAEGGLIPRPISSAYICPSRRKSSLVPDQTYPICGHAVFSYCFPVYFVE